MGHSSAEPFWVEVVWLVCVAACLLSFFVFMSYKPGDNPEQTKGLMNLIRQPDFARDRHGARQIDKRTEGLLRFMADIIQKGIDACELKNMDAWQVINVLWCLLDGIFLRDARGVSEIARLSSVVLIKQALDLVLNGLSQA